MIGEAGSSLSDVPFRFGRSVLRSIVVGQAGSNFIVAGIVDVGADCSDRLSSDGGGIRTSDWLSSGGDVLAEVSMDSLGFGLSAIAIGED